MQQTQGAITYRTQSCVLIKHDKTARNEDMSLSKTVKTVNDQKKLSGDLETKRRFPTQALKCKPEAKHLL